MDVVRKVFASVSLSFFYQARKKHNYVCQGTFFFFEFDVWQIIMIHM